LAIFPHQYPENPFELADEGISECILRERVGKEIQCGVFLLQKFHKGFDKLMGVELLVVPLGEIK
jgi:hypothetical protein